MNADDHDHDHDHDDHAPTRDDEDLELTEAEARFLALKSLLIEQGVMSADEIRARMEFNERGSPH